VVGGDLRGHLAQPPSGAGTTSATSLASSAQEAPSPHPPPRWHSLCGAMTQPDTKHFLSGYLLFRDFCLKHLEEAKPLVEFYEEVKLGWPGPEVRLRESVCQGSLQHGSPAWAV